ncbi:TetR/AcrR family transcriptional regulator [Pseudactinotalea suaedae]|uniref:TetR/AcrR family transcriptional regulator n=1 Tax=Pseudactinotalea suaedae TaxID=1524924 RepID=UPI0012E28BA8|nr:TetR/AcrR family transcriptional regulator [Pseudactinotalea suaedae]
MQTKRSFTAEGRRTQIVEATVRVIAREGLTRASFGRIAAEGGLSSPGMISYHFADKDELLAVLCDTVLSDCVRTLEEAVEAATDPVEGLTAYLTAFVSWQDTHRDEVAALRRLAVDWRRPGAAAAFDERPLMQPLLGVLHAGQASGVLRSLHPGWVAQTVLCAVESFPQALHEDPELDPQTFAETLVELFGRGLVVS